MIIDVPLEDLDLNKYNSRVGYSTASVEKMANSMARHGQLHSVRIRRNQKSGRFEVVFGHRRLLAARKLGWATIKAEVVDLNDEAALVESLVENVEREDLSDYEKALIYERINVEFGKTYEEIGRMVGLSKQAISNHVGMLKLFAPQFLAQNLDLPPLLHEISEHHARILARAEDEQDRASLLRLTARDNLSVRDVSNIVFHLRSWFHSEGSGTKDVPGDFAPGNQAFNQTDETTISYAMKDKFVMSERGDQEAFSKLYLFEKGYSIFPMMSEGLLEGEKASLYKYEWSRRFAPSLKWKIEDLKTNLLSSSTALVTMKVMYGEGDARFRARGTIVLISRNKEWKILHEHWSTQERKPLAGLLPSMPRAGAATRRAAPD